MKKLILILAVIFASCSNDCNYNPDHELIQQITDKIEVLKEKQADATLDAIKDQYQKEIDQLSDKMDDALGDCE